MSIIQPLLATLMADHYISQLNFKWRRTRLFSLGESRNLPSTVQVRRPTVSWAWSTVNSPGVLLLTGSITFFLLLTVPHTVDRRRRNTERKSLISDNGVCLDSTAVLQVDLWTAEAKADRRTPRVTCQTLKTPGELVCSCYLFSVWLSKHSKCFSLITQN